MKKWLPLLLVPVSLGACFCFRTRAWSQDQTSPANPVPAVDSQAELDAYAQTHPEANFDKLGHAFGNTQSRLFWNTDLESAKREAAREGKPILALRLLGNLSDEYSCANSRFFRVLFYPQQEINARLRRDFVLYWLSERPVPVITIDMGDGRVLKRTITGNSAHYLLDSTGCPLDVYPGLSSPQAFRGWLDQAQKLAGDFKALPAERRTVWLANWHKEQISAAIKRQSVGLSPALLDQRIKAVYATNPLERQLISLAVPAQSAATLAVTKMAVEAPVLGSFQGRSVNLAPFSAPFNAADPLPVLDAATRARIRAMNPLGETPAAEKLVPQTQQVSTSHSDPKSFDPRFDNLIRSLQNDLRADTNRNQSFSLSIHASFAQGREGNFESLNRRIYDRLFLTPRSDPWLGLTSDTTFSALQNDGVTPPANTTPALSTVVAQN